MSSPEPPPEREGAKPAAGQGPTQPPASTPPQPKQVEDRPSTWQPALYFKMGVLLAAIAYAIAFVVQNNRQIKIDFIFATTRVSLIWEILLLLAVGVIGGVLLSQLYRHRRRSQLAKKARKPADARPDVGGRDKAVGKTG